MSDEFLGTPQHSLPELVEQLWFPKGRMSRRRVTTPVLLLFGSLLARAQHQTLVIDAVHKGDAVGHEQDGERAIRDAIAAAGNVNERDQSGWTPLMHAALECRADEMKLLLAGKR